MLGLVFYIVDGAKVINVEKQGYLFVLGLIALFSGAGLAVLIFRNDGVLLILATSAVILTSGIILGIELITFINTKIK